MILHTALIIIVYALSALTAALGVAMVIELAFYAVVRRAVTGKWR